MKRIRDEVIISHEIPMTYAGRLDPMADGLVIFLVGEMRFFKDKFLGLQKTYGVKFFLGCKTDTYDILGIAEFVKNNTSSYNEIKEVAENFYTTGNSVQQLFPPYSSRKVSGKSLFAFAKEGGVVPEISHTVTLYSLENFSVQELNKNELKKIISQDIGSVSGDFRQEISKQSWQSVIEELSENIALYSVDLGVSSGFYVRSWVHELGQKIGSGAVTFSITRSIIEVFTLSMLNNQSYRVFTKDDPIIAQLFS